MKTRRKFFKNSALVGGALALGALSLKAKQERQDKNLDSEFWEFFKGFESDISKLNTLNTHYTYAIKLSALIACGGKESFKELFSEALERGVKAEALKEVLYQSVAYVGFAKAYEFFNLSNEILRAKNVPLPLKKQSKTTRANRYDEGLKLQIAIFGDVIIQGNENTPADMKHFRRFLSENCFGDYYTRAGLDLKLRELITFVFLAALGGCEAQLEAHTSGNLKVGNDRSVLIATLTQLCPLLGYPRTLNALNIVGKLSK
ncbi:carboxymuconolactone decarboxylase family protein [Campylobacter sp. VTCC 70190]|uniref:carboxymuconolactone decarboxylase family protein n=1 Tax=Campylobacter sp. VTCC 70190 TaxID=3392118 RepID=UPI00398F895C